MAVSQSINLTKMDEDGTGIEGIASLIGEFVRVSGPIKPREKLDSDWGVAELVGPLSGVTFLAEQVIVYMEHGQNTTFVRRSNDPITLRAV